MTEPLMPSFRAQLTPLLMFLLSGCLTGETSSYPFSRCGEDAIPQDISLFEKEGYVLLAHGTLVREEYDHTDNTEFTSSPKTRLTLELREYRGEDTCAPFLGTAHRMGKTITLPMEYELWGPPSIIPDATGEMLLLSVTIHRTWDGDDELKVGDFRNTYSNEIEGIGEHHDVKMEGLEDCDLPSSLGSCRTNR